MKHILLTLCAVCALCGTASARRFQVGVRGGINSTDFRFAPLQIDETRFVASASRMGYEAGFVVRLNLTKVLHLQSELNYDFVNYLVRATSPTISSTHIRLRSERLEVPVQLGLQFGPVRLFGGASFRLNSDINSSNPDLLKIDFGSDRVALMGGLGINIKHFFVDFRVQGYPNSKHTNTFISNGVSQKARMRSDVVWGGSLGFFF